MRIQVVSDLHFEFCPDKGAALVKKMARAKADVLVVAGDLATLHLAEAWNMLCDTFKEVVYVPGNHEYYGSSFDVAHREMKTVARAYDNLHVLRNKCVTIRGVKFVGTTLWFAYSGPSSTDDMLADFRHIGGIRAHVNAENAKAVDFLMNNVKRGNMVVTHHVPTPRSTPHVYDRSLLNRYFVCDVEGIIEQHKPRLWIHGHTHNSFDYELVKTRVVCNPYGYCNYDENPKFNPGLVVEV
jgi:Icc-related predicted phosphoesterase